MTNLIVGGWFLLYAVLGLVSTDLPKWLIPLTAGIAGIAILLSGSWKKQP